MEKQKKMTIDTLAQMTANGFHAVDTRFNTLESTMKQGFEIVLDELRGLRDDVKQARAASNVDNALLQGKIETLEKDMKLVKAKVKL